MTKIKLGKSGFKSTPNLHINVKDRANNDTFL